MIDLHVHLLGHRDREATAEHIRSFLEQARRQKLKVIGFADHDMYWDSLDFDLIRATAAEFPDITVKVGLEVDYREEAEQGIRERLRAYPFDYVIGSVHQIGGWFFDFPDEELNHRQKDADTVYREYFRLVEKAAVSGMFHIIGHLDIIKIFNLRSVTDVSTLARPALDAIKRNGLAVEINTNGRYKPVNEFYPQAALIELARDLGIDFTFGSDAHEAKVVGRDIPEAAALLKSHGIQEVVAFSAGAKVRFALDDV